MQRFYVCLYIFFNVSRFTINVQYDEHGQETVIPPINSTNIRTNILSVKTSSGSFRFTSGPLPVELVIIGLNFLKPDFNRSVKEGYLFYEQEVFLS